MGTITKENAIYRKQKTISEEHICQKWRSVHAVRKNSNSRQRQTQTAEYCFCHEWQKTWPSVSWSIFHVNTLLWYWRSDVYSHGRLFSKKNLRRQTEERHRFAVFVFPVIVGKTCQNIRFTYNLPNRQVQQSLRGRNGSCGFEPCSLTETWGNFFFNLLTNFRKLLAETFSEVSDEEQGSKYQLPFVSFLTLLHQSATDSFHISYIYRYRCNLLVNK